MNCHFTVIFALALGACSNSISSLRYTPRTMTVARGAQTSV